MGRPRKPIREILLAGNPGNKSKAEIAERLAEEQEELAVAASDERQQLDLLIAQTIVACKRGQTIDGRRNPAFANLRVLLKCREMLENNRPPKTTLEKTADVLAKSRALMAEAGIHTGKAN
jgi:hypothetical protein